MKGWYSVNGRVLDKRTRRPLPDLCIRGFDKDLMWDDSLGETYTDADGAYDLLFQEKDFKELFEGQPEVYLVVYSSEGVEIVRTGAIKMPRLRKSMILNLAIDLPKPAEEHAT
jgi:carotenoid cleavage dioxygenase